MSVKCPVCGTDLEFKVEKDEYDLFGTAECRTCNVSFDVAITYPEDDSLGGLDQFDLTQ